MFGCLCGSWNTLYVSVCLVVLSGRYSIILWSPIVHSLKKAETEVLFSVIEKLKSDAAEENEGRRTEIEELTNGKLLIIHVSFSM